MHKIEAPGATADNRFTEGDPSSGVPATQVSAPWLNSVQSEIVNVLLAAGIDPQTVDTETGDQLVAALQAMGLGGYASAADAQALSSLTKILTPGTLDGAFKGGNQSLTAMGFQKLPGGLILQITQTTMSYTAGFNNVLLPISFPSESLLLLCADAGSSSSSATAWKVNSSDESSVNVRWEPIVGDTAGTRFCFIFAIGK